MKKEIVVAIIIGLALGLAITYGVYTARRSLTDPVANQVLEDLTTNSSPQPSELSTLVITTPKDESIQSVKEVTIAGTTMPNSYVVIFINDDENVTNADESGNFSIESNLELGSNIITIHSLSEDGHDTIAERTVIYAVGDLNSATPEEASESAQPKASPSPTPSARPRSASGSATRR